MGGFAFSACCRHGLKGATALHLSRTSLERVDLTTRSPLARTSVSAPGGAALLEFSPDGAFAFRYDRKSSESFRAQPLMRMSSWHPIPERVPPVLATNAIRKRKVLRQTGRSTPFGSPVV